MMLPEPTLARSIQTTSFSDATLATALANLQAWLDARQQERVLGVAYQADGSAHSFVVYYTEG